VGAGKAAQQKLPYRVRGSALQDGTRMTAADVLYSYAFAYRWGARVGGEDAHYDPLVAAATAVMRAQLLGVRVVGTDTGCGCFGAAHTHPVSRIDLLRNAVLAGLAFLAVLASSL